jgi:hypothetical protein
MLLLFVQEEMTSPLTVSWFCWCQAQRRNSPLFNLLGGGSKYGDDPSPASYNKCNNHDIGPRNSPDGFYASNYKSITKEDCKAIIGCCLDDWEIAEPHKFQAQSIYRGVYYNHPFMSITTKVVLGKSLMMTDSATLCSGVCICGVPIKGLGTALVSKIIHSHKNIKVCHVKKFLRSIGNVLRALLKVFGQEQCDNQDIILYMTPKCILLNLDWMLVLCYLARINFIPILYVDKAHSVWLNSDNCQPKFLKSMKTFLILYDLLSKRFHRIAMLATSF